MNHLSETVNNISQLIATVFRDPQTYIQLVVVVTLYTLAYVIALFVKRNITVLKVSPDEHSHPLKKLAFNIGIILAPLLGLFFIKIAYQVVLSLEYDYWFIRFILAVAVLLFFYSAITTFVTSQFAVRLFKWIGLPILFLHVVDLLNDLIIVLEGISIEAGNVNVSAYGFLRVLIFGLLLFWLGRVSNTFGKAIIKKQVALDVPTKEVFTKLFEVSLFCIIILLLLNVMGINLTTLAVFGGALGVGIGLGLQSIASNFVSGIIILLDKSLTIGDYVELDNGQTGFVREFRMRYAVLETYDGKDILVPNEMFISNLLVNWSHKDPKQRYKVDFSVPYSTDVRSMVELIKVAVAEHPKVISGKDVPFEERPDCEIEGFGDSGINMFVEFWMEGIDDGKNRVGGDLMLTILETLRENGIEIPFPQREVRILNPQDPTSR
ncbi:MAG: small-conductance mechanosensitive channel [Alphaproteobacteria bacterium]|jgi:small-conductance mechanosensitive channel